jgi:hypothetical protein
MSVIAFANQLNAREETAKADVDKAKAENTGTKDYIVVLAGLVPVEVLALHAAALEVTTKSVHGTKIITEPTTLKWTFLGLILLSVLLYVAVHFRNLDGLDVLRAAIPGAAFVAWSMAQPMTAFDAVVGTRLSAGARTIIAAFAAVVLAVLAKGLILKADDKPPKVGPQPPTAGPTPPKAGHELVLNVTLFEIGVDRRRR